MNISGFVKNWKCTIYSEYWVWLIPTDHSWFKSHIYLVLKTMHIEKQASSDVVWYPMLAISLLNRKPIFWRSICVKHLVQILPSEGNLLSRSKSIDVYNWMLSVKLFKDIYGQKPFFNQKKYIKHWSYFDFTNHLWWSRWNKIEVSVWYWQQG